MGRADAILLLVSVKAKALQRLREARSRADSIDVSWRRTRQFEEWRLDVENVLARLFGAGSRHVEKFKRLAWSPVIMTNSTTEADWNRAFLSSLETAKALLSSTIREAEDYDDDSETAAGVAHPKAAAVVQQDQQAVQLRVAKISAIQAVVVALITAIAGVVVGYLAAPGRSVPQPQRRLVIESVQLPRAFSLARVVVSINGQAYSYPATELWTQIGDAKENFLLPAAPRYRVYVTGFVSNPGQNPIVRLSAPRADDFAAEQIPVEDRVVPLHTAEGSYRGSHDMVTVQYSIR